MIVHEGTATFPDLLDEAAGILSERVGIDKSRILGALGETARLGYTPIGHHMALPHARLEEMRTHEVVIVHSAEGLRVAGSEELIYALIILLGPLADPGRHLRFLAELANRAENIDFAGAWRTLQDPDEIRARFVRSGSVMQVTLTAGDLMGVTIRDIALHENCLIAFITRGERMIVPHGDTVLEKGDRLMLIGEADAVAESAERFEPGAAAAD